MFQGARQHCGALAMVFLFHLAQIAHGNARFAGRIHTPPVAQVQLILAGLERIGRIQETGTAAGTRDASQLHIGAVWKSLAGGNRELGTQERGRTLLGAAFFGLHQALFMAEQQVQCAFHFRANIISHRLGQDDGTSQGINGDARQDEDGCIGRVAGDHF